MRRTGISVLLVTLAALLLSVGAVWAGGASEPEAEMSGAMVSTGKYNEAPMLAQLVAAGELPPVDDRLPEVPKVHHMIESVGRYGGELRAFAVTDNIWENDLQGQFGSSLFRRPLDDPFGIEGDLAEGAEINPERTIMTVLLRKGLKWSDGTPYTSEDVRFMLEDYHWHPELRGGSGYYGIDSVEIVDDFTLRFHSPDGLGDIPLILSAWRGGFRMIFTPSEYMKQFHIDYNSDAQKLATENGFDSWTDYFQERINDAPLRNPEKPQVEPWELTQITDTIKVMERNPYFWRVDPEGNQLPYIDRVVIQIVTPDVYQLKVSGGDASIAYYRTSLDNLPLYVAGAETGDYRVMLYRSHSTAWMKYFTVGRFHQDPVIREVFSNLDFRHALSVALNREEINNVIYQGLGVPGVVAPLESVSFYQEGWRSDWAQYDPELANQLLDRVGLDKRDAEGFRMLPDGNPFNFVIDYGADRWTAELELYVEQYRDVGIRTIIRLGDPRSYSDRRRQGEALAWVHNNPIVPQAGERQLMEDFFTWDQQFDAWTFWIRSHANALRSTLPEGALLPSGWQLLPPVAGWEYVGGGGRPAEEPPLHWKEWRALKDRWLTMELGSEEFIQAGIEVFDYVVKDFGIIGAVGETPSVIVAKNDLGNVVTEDIWPGTGVADLLMQSWMDQLYWKK